MANEGGFGLDMLQIIQQFASMMGGQQYQNNPLGFLGFNQQYQQSPMMGMMQQFAPGMANKLSPIIPYSSSMYQYEIMQSRKEQENKMQVFMASPLFNRLYQGGLENVFGYSPMKAAQSMYTPGGGKTGMYQAMSTMWGQTLGPMIEPDAYLDRHRQGLISSYQGLRIAGDGGAKGYYAGISNTGIKSLESGIKSNMNKGGMLRGYNASDWADIARIGADYGELTSSEGAMDIGTINNKIEGMGKSIKLGMAVFNTMNKADIMDTIKNITMGEISTTDFGSVSDVLSKLSTLSAKADKSIKFMTKIAQEGASLYKQMGYSAMSGMDYAITSRSNFIETSGLSDEYISSVGGFAAANNIRTQGHLGIMSSGLTKKIMGSYEILQSRLGESGMAPLRAMMMKEGYTENVLRAMTTKMSEAGVSGNVMRNTSSYAGAGLTSFTEHAGSVNAHALQNVGGMKGIVSYVEGKMGMSIDQLFEKNGGNEEAVKQNIATKLQSQGISFEVARDHAENIVSIRKRGTNMQGGFADYEGELKTKAAATKIEQQRFTLAEKLRPASTDTIKRMLQMNYEEASLGNIGKRLFGGRDTMTQSELFKELAKTDNDDAKLLLLARATMSETTMNETINGIKGLDYKQKTTIKKLGAVYAAQQGGVKTGLTKDDFGILSGEIEEYGLGKYFDIVGTDIVAKDDILSGWNADRAFSLVGGSSAERDMLKKLKNMSKSGIKLNDIFKKENVISHKLTKEQFEKIRDEAAKNRYSGIEAALGDKTFESFSSMNKDKFIKAITAGRSENYEAASQQAVEIAALYGHIVKKNEKANTEKVEVNASGEVKVTGSTIIVNSTKPSTLDTDKTPPGVNG